MSLKHKQNLSLRLAVISTLTHLYGGLPVVQHFVYLLKHLLVVEEDLKDAETLERAKHSLLWDHA